jgi:hypothetical protein
LVAESCGDEHQRERQQSASGVCFEAGIRHEALYVWSSARAAVDFICRDLYVNVVDSFSNFLFSQAFFIQARLTEKAFSRTGFLSFPRLIACLLGGYTSKVQSELDAFFANLANRADLLREVSAQAFAKARKQVSATAFELLNDYFLALVERAIWLSSLARAARRCRRCHSPAPDIVGQDP